MMGTEFIAFDKVGKEVKWFWNFLKDIPYWSKSVLTICVLCNN
jgi:hypothetical protein